MAWSERTPTDCARHRHPRSDYARAAERLYRTGLRWAVATLPRSAESCQAMSMALAPVRVSLIWPDGAHSFRRLRVTCSRTDAVVRVVTVTVSFPEQPRVGNRNVPVCPGPGSSARPSSALRPRSADPRPRPRSRPATISGPRPRATRAPRWAHGLDDGPAARHRPRWRPRSRPRCAAAWWVSGAAVCVMAGDRQARPRQPAAIPVRAAAAVPRARAGPWSAPEAARAGRSAGSGRRCGSGTRPGPQPATAGPPGPWPGTARLSSAASGGQPLRFAASCRTRYMTASSGPSPKAARPVAA